MVRKRKPKAVERWVWHTPTGYICTAYLCETKADALKAMNDRNPCSALRTLAKLKRAGWEPRLYRLIPVPSSPRKRKVKR